MKARGFVHPWATINARTHSDAQTLPATALTSLTEAQRRALVLADHCIALNAGRDEALLAPWTRGGWTTASRFRTR